MTTTLRSLVLPTLLLLALPLVAPVPLAGQGRGRGRGGEPRSTVTVVAIFRDGDQAIFHRYFVEHHVTAQPLPPGIAKNLARGKPLPPGIAKRAVPADLLLLGPRVDKDVSFAIVGDVVVATRGGIVIDILAGVFK